MSESERTNKDKLLVRRASSEKDKWKIKGCPPHLLLQSFPQARALQLEGPFACLKECVRTVGGSIGPCSGAGDPSWSGLAGWAQ